MTHSSAFHINLTHTEYHLTRCLGVFSSSVVQQMISYAEQPLITEMHPPVGESSSIRDLIRNAESPKPGSALFELAKLRRQRALKSNQRAIAESARRKKISRQENMAAEGINERDFAHEKRRSPFRKDSRVLYPPYKHVGK